MGDSLGRGKGPLFTFLNDTVGCLEEPAVLAQDLVLVIAGQSAKGGRAVDDGIIITTNVGNNERASEIDGTEYDFGMRSGGDTSEDG